MFDDGAAVVVAQWGLRGFSLSAWVQQAVQTHAHEAVFIWLLL